MIFFCPLIYKFMDALKSGSLSIHEFAKRCLIDTPSTKPSYETVCVTWKHAVSGGCPLFIVWSIWLPRRAVQWADGDCLTGKIRMIFIQIFHSSCDSCNFPTRAPF